MHYLKAVEAAGTLDGPTVAAKMREMPVNDFMTKNDKLLATIPGDEAFKSMEEGECPLLKTP